jgi:hypothetical protein
MRRGVCQLLVAGATATFVLTALQVNQRAAHERRFGGSPRPAGSHGDSPHATGPINADMPVLVVTGAVLAQLHDSKPCHRDTISMAGRAPNTYQNTEGTTVETKLGWLDHQPLPYLIYDVRAQPLASRGLANVNRQSAGVVERLRTACR